MVYFHSCQFDLQFGSVGQLGRQSVFRTLIVVNNDNCQYYIMGRCLPVPSAVSFHSILVWLGKCEKWEWEMKRVRGSDTPLRVGTKIYAPQSLPCPFSRTSFWVGRMPGVCVSSLTCLFYPLRPPCPLREGGRPPPPPPPHLSLVSRYYGVVRGGVHLFSTLCSTRTSWPVNLCSCTSGLFYSSYYLYIWLAETNSVRTGLNAPTRWICSPSLRGTIVNIWQQLTKS